MSDIYIATYSQVSAFGTRFRHINFHLSTHCTNSFLFAIANVT